LPSLPFRRKVTADFFRSDLVEVNRMDRPTPEQSSAELLTQVAVLQSENRALRQFVESIARHVSVASQENNDYVFGFRDGQEVFREQAIQLQEQLQEMSFSAVE
jgi:hypothetical protein